MVHSVAEVLLFFLASGRAFRPTGGAEGRNTHEEATVCVSEPREAPAPPVLGHICPDTAPKNKKSSRSGTNRKWGGQCRKNGVDSARLGTSRETLQCADAGLRTVGQHRRSQWNQRTREGSGSCASGLALRCWSCWSSVKARCLDSSASLNSTSI